MPSIEQVPDSNRRASAPTPGRLKPTDPFARRHLGVTPAEADAMAQTLGYDSAAALAEAAVPESIRSEALEGLPEPVGERAMLDELRAIADQNQVYRSYIGQGYANTLTPAPIRRNILENPGWYTQYTPYQAEISQGRMEALLNFQTMVCDLTGLDIANASLLDEATAAAEAMAMAYGLRGKRGKNALLVDPRCHPQTIEVLRTRAEPVGIEIRCDAPIEPDADFSDAFAVVLQYPDTGGVARDLAPVAEAAAQAKALTVVACDLLALALLKPPGEMGADIAVGSAQRFGVPMGFGGPHAAFLATRDAFKRKIPGRIVGVSKDARDKPAVRLALQTREQHIRRDKATSNICTAQALLANIASAYAVYHGPEGIAAIARRVRRLAAVAEERLRARGCEIEPGSRFDTVTVAPPDGDAQAVHDRAAQARINLRHIDERRVCFALDETVEPRDLADLLDCFPGGDGPSDPADLESAAAKADLAIETALQRASPFLQDAVFNCYHTETELMRYLKRLENKDLSLTRSMIPLGSCTMKLNATSEMLPITWPEFANLHPFGPPEQAKGYAILMEQLEAWLAAITGFHAVSLQPNAGSQGEYAGLLAIRAYHRSRGDDARSVCLIPTSAHGTNPASAVMAGMKVVTVACDKRGNIDLEDLEEKAKAHADDLAALMVTYPSTHGVFETSIRKICSVVHERGGLVYMDGANMNAQCGLTSPGAIGADVCHLNLHKTFCIPHGGGGPGVGPIAVNERLAPFLPRHETQGKATGPENVGAVAAAPCGSAGILPISWAYIRMMGAEGLTEATRVAILNANYMAKRLEDAFPVLYKGQDGLVAHEFIVDFRPWKEKADIEVEDVAKRLMDYGFHAPTMSWPVPGTMMVEPTESESRAELDRLCDAFLAIKGEMDRIASGEWPSEDNPLKNAPHSDEAIVADDWSPHYSRELAAFPAPWTRESKYWPPVSRVDNVYGDRNLVCTCAPLSAYEE